MLVGFGVTRTWVAEYEIQKFTVPQEIKHALLFSTEYTMTTSKTYRSGFNFNFRKLALYIAAEYKIGNVAKTHISSMTSFRATPSVRSSTSNASRPSKSWIYRMQAHLTSGTNPSNYQYPPIQTH